MGAVLTMVMILLRYGCTLHDEVTGSMILEETLEKVRYLPEETISKELAHAEEQGSAVGNPRLWLGKYEIQLKNGFGSVSGGAIAGEWSTEIRISKFQPGDFLRTYEVMDMLNEGAEQDGS